VNRREGTQQLFKHSTSMQVLLEYSYLDYIYV